MSVLILVSNGDIQRSNRIYSQDQHAQAQHWLRHAQAQLMHDQAQPYLISPRRRRGGDAAYLILATYPSANSRHVLEYLEHRSTRSERAERQERSEHF